MTTQNNNREVWGTRLGFIVAAVGSAVGLGNVWKFPFITGMNGGGAFVMFYLVSIVLIGLPVMLIEFAIGRNTHRNPVGAFKKLDPNRPFYIIGIFGVVVAFIILSYYSVVAGWTVAYVFKALLGGFSAFTSADIAAESFKEFSSNPILPVLSHGVFMALCIFVVMRGVKKGLEKGNLILMPTLFIIIILLMLRGITLPGSLEGIKFLFAPDFSKLTGHAMLTALGHAFFTLSLGMGAMLTYGSYLDKKVNLVKSALWIIVADTSVALMAGIAIFTAVFAMGFEPNTGPGLVFHVLPAIFAKMPGDLPVGVLFFMLLSIAAVTSGISLLEVVTAYFIDERSWSRRKAAIVFGFVIFLIGVPSALSFGVLGSVKVFGMILFDFFDYLSFKYVMPLGGLAMVLFTIFRWKPQNFLAELGHGYPQKVGNNLAVVLLVIAAAFVAITFVAGIYL